MCMSIYVCGYLCMTALYKAYIEIAISFYLHHRFEAVVTLCES